MKKLFVLYLIFSAAISLSAQVEIEWQRCYGGSIIDKAFDVQQTADGGFIIIGSTFSTNGNVSFNHGQFDIWIVKTDHLGSIQWEKCYGSSGNEDGYSIKQTNDGGYIFTGSVAGNDGDVVGWQGNWDFWVVKIDTYGTIEWQRCLGGTNAEESNIIIQTEDLGFLVAGYTSSSDGDVVGFHGGKDAWIVKLSSNGDIDWQKCLGGSGNDKARSVYQTNDGGYIVACHSDCGDYDVTVNIGNYDYWIVKLTPTGSIQWERSYGGTLFDYAESIIQTTDGGFIIAGMTASNNVNVTGLHGLSDIWILKIDSLGNIQWQKCYGGGNYEWAYSIIEDDNGYVFTGIAFSAGGDVIGNHSPGGQGDIWTVKIDYNGNIIWQRCFGGLSSDESYAIKETTDGGYVLAGNTQSNDGDITSMYGFYDFWVIKFSGPNIKGQAFHDINSNGIKDAGEQGIVAQLVQLNPGNHYTFTNNNGYYYFRGDTGVTNTVKYVAQNYWYETTNNYYHYVTLDSLSHVVDTLDYAVKSRVNVNDVSVYITGSTTRANFETHYWLTYKNWGTVTASGTIEFHYDPLLTYNASTPLVPVSQVGNTLTFAYDTLGPGAQRIMRLDFQVPGVQNLGDTLHSYAMITPLIPDTFVTNNYDTLHQVITGSYDPNDKSVSPAGYGQWGFVEHGQRLTYTIRFQNTGTDTAFTVVIRDTLDTDLDIETFVVEAYSHNVTWQLHSGNELFFTFQNIMLPDSNVNEPESHGFIRYSISPKPGLADGTTATNTSYIFFDYNPAIVTNTTLNTFVTNIPVAKPIMEVLKTLVFPNPSTDIVYINLPELTRKVEVYNLNGELVQQLVPQKQVVEINAKELAKGVYVVKIFSGKGVVSTRFVKD